MTANFLFLLAATSAQVFGLSPGVPTSYPWNPHTIYTPWSELLGISETRLCKFVSRKEGRNKLLFVEPGYSHAVIFVDKFEILGEDPGTAPAARTVDILTVEFRPPRADISVEPSLIPDSSYVVSFQSPNSSHFVQRARSGRGDSLVKVELTTGQRPGLFCMPMKQIRRARDAEGKEDPIATLLLSLGLSLAHVRIDIDAYERVRILEELKLRIYAKKKLYIPKYEREEGQPAELFLAGRRSYEWVEQVFVPAMMAELAKCEDQRLRMYGLGLVSKLPGGEEASRQYFEWLYAWCKAGGDKDVGPSELYPTGGRPVPDGWIHAVPKERRFRAAVELPKYRGMFFPYGESDPPPSADTIRTIISWLDKINDDFLVVLLRTLASWADVKAVGLKVSDLQPKLKPNAGLEILNKKELVRMWQLNPPPIRRGG